MCFSTLSRTVCRSGWVIATRRGVSGVLRMKARISSGCSRILTVVMSLMYHTTLPSSGGDTRRTRRQDACATLGPVLRRQGVAEEKGFGPGGEVLLPAEDAAGQLI